MRSTNFVIVFICIAIPTFIIFNIKNNAYAEMIYQKTLLNNLVDNALVDTSEMLLSNTESYFDKEKILNNYYTFLNMNGINVTDMEDKTPLFAFINYEGVAINTDVENYYDITLEKVWLPEVAYSDVIDDYIVEFSLKDYIKIHDTKNNYTYEDDYYNLSSYVSDFMNSESYENKRNITVKNILNRELNNNLNTLGYENFEVLLSYGDSDFNNNIDEITTLSIAKDLYLNLDKKYNNNAIGGTEINYSNDIGYFANINNEFYYNNGSLKKGIKIFEKDIFKYEVPYNVGN